MIEVKKLSYSYPQKDLYKDVSFTIEDNMHCAFIGTNGTGKSTLIDMIMHKEEYLYDGKINIKPDCRIGYVSQFSQVDENCTMTVFEYLSQEFLALQEQMNQVCEQMGTAEDIEPLMEKYQQILDSVARIDGDNYEVNIRKKLKLAGLEKREQLEVNKLSGGEFKLLQVMKEMLVVPDLMIMDEPDVFLDFENLNALKALINEYKGTLLVITHNRYLLNHCFNKIIHLENMEIQEYDGRYIDYNLELLKTKIELQELSAADTAEIERNKKLVEKLRKEATMFSNAAIGRSLHARVSIVERLEARRIKPPFVEIKEPEIKFNKMVSEEKIKETDSNDIIAEDLANNKENDIMDNNNMENDTEKEVVLEVTNYNLSFDDDLLENVSFTIGATDKVAIVGANGTGKTTLLREIFHKKNEAIHRANDTEVLFLSQIPGEMLNEKHTVLEEFEEAGLETEKQVKEYLEKFCFDEDMLYCRIETLSGGEKNMLQLAKIGLGTADLLLLDEPTSHLDLYSQKSLEKAVKKYKGAVLCVSHDFYTVANCMDYVLYVENHTVRRMSMRKFRQMIYANHFDKDYLANEQKKKEVESQIEKALIANDFEKAAALADDLEKIIQKL